MKSSPDSPEEPLAAGGWACRYANALLAQLETPVRIGPQTEAPAALVWARSGAMTLTGEREGPAQLCPVPLASLADGLIAALHALRPCAALRAIDGGALLGERAALGQLERAGAIAAGGACRLLYVVDGVLAVNLARQEDWALLPAWLEAGELHSWEALAGVLCRRPLDECVQRARLLGLAVAPFAAPRRQSRPWWREFHRGTAHAPRRAGAPRVIDLSALWAGPLAAQLLQLMGAEVIKVESLSRPDGLRADGSGFFALLNAAKQSLALDFGTRAGREALRELLMRADIIIEAARPRALRQLGIDATQILERNPSATWIAISGYGREEPQGQWTAYGDDAGVAAGLSHILRECSGRLVFCADAVADPLTGLHAALAAWSSYAQGGGRGLSIALADVVAHGIAFSWPREGFAARAAHWQRYVKSADIAAPRARAAAVVAPPLGCHTDALLAALN